MPAPSDRVSEWIDSGSAGGFDKSEPRAVRALRIYSQIVEDHTPDSPDDPCPICEVVDCEERRLARFRMILGPGQAVPPTAPDKLRD